MEGFAEVLAFMQMLEYSAAYRCWRLVQGGEDRLMGLRDGIFVEGDLSQHSPMAAAFIRQWLPIFNVPWIVKRSLDNAGVQGCRTLTPAVLR